MYPRANNKSVVGYISISFSKVTMNGAARGVVEANKA